MSSGVLDAAERIARLDYILADYSYLVERAIYDISQIASIASIASLNAVALARLEGLLSLYPRLSSAFLEVAKGIERYGDCAAVDETICRVSLVSEIEAEVFPDTYSFDDGRFVVHTALHGGVVELLYHAAKQVEAQFFRMVGDTTPIAGTQMKY
ncbi:hypothetical protein [Candidatus Reidiella endopervernicosa]|uniref:Uncharacterized protein n=1 Tax=Candidatus Reidiella endopervernicosa TaxID=2738883 RepID=A0A6N0HZR7_9GAMM|nr:hypothetical protein [Candidatus Reidiella endopervernicosa]QKQ27858.1 hypothetical protein HUE57_17405 [Candidatus Reidiella endopervernicosa]